MESHEGAAADRAFVDSLMGDISTNLQRWADQLAAQAPVTYEADLGDVYAVVDRDGRLVELALSPDVMSAYTSVQLTARINAVIEALREQVRADAEHIFGGGRLE